MEYVNYWNINCIKKQKRSVFDTLVLPLNVREKNYKQESEDTHYENTILVKGKATSFSKLLSFYILSHIDVQSKGYCPLLFSCNISWETFVLLKCTKQNKEETDKNIGCI